MTWDQTSGASAGSPGAIGQRCGRPFALRLSCRLYPVWMRTAQVPGTVVNISLSALFIEIDSAKFPEVLRREAPVRVVVDLPRHPSFSPRCLECTGAVVRLVAAEAQIHVAVQIERIQVTEQRADEPSGGDWPGHLPECSGPEGLRDTTQGRKPFPPNLSSSQNRTLPMAFPSPRKRKSPS